MPFFLFGVRVFLVSFCPTAPFALCVCSCALCPGAETKNLIKFRRNRIWPHVLSTQCGRCCGLKGAKQNEIQILIKFHAPPNTSGNQKSNKYQIFIIRSGPLCNYLYFVQNCLKDFDKGWLRAGGKKVRPKMFVKISGQINERYKSVHINFY